MHVGNRYEYGRTFGRCGSVLRFALGTVVDGDVADNRLQVFNCAARKHYFPAYFGIGVSISSMGLLTPRWSWVQPSRIPAMDAISRVTS